MLIGSGKASVNLTPEMGNKYVDLTLDRRQKLEALTFSTSELWERSNGRWLVCSRTAVSTCYAELLMAKQKLRKHNQLMNTLPFVSFFFSEGAELQLLQSLTVFKYNYVVTSVTRAVSQRSWISRVKNANQRQKFATNERASRAQHVRVMALNGSVLVFSFGRVRQTFLSRDKSWWLPLSCLDLDQTLMWDLIIGYLDSTELSHHRLRWWEVAHWSWPLTW